jgi:fluoroacetyl-CoA thioesterase
MDIPVGLVSELSMVVQSKDSARALGSGGLDVFGTPAMLALMEKTALEMIRPYLPDGSDSVGTSVNLTHTRATPINGKVICRAEVSKAEGRSVGFKIECTDEAGNSIGAAEHGRFVVDIQRFMSKIGNK